MNRSSAVRRTRVTEPFGVARGEDACPPMVDFRGHNGVAVALPYTELLSLAYHPTDGITMEFREHHITIRGRNLRPLYDLLVDHRVTYVQEDDFDDAPETATFVDAIMVERGQPGIY